MRDTFKSKITTTPLSEEEMNKRTPPKPWELLGALHGPIKTPSCKSRIPKVSRARREK